MKMTQTQKVIAVMNENVRKWMPAYRFVGKYSTDQGTVFLSYKAPARLSEIYRDFDTIIERRQEYINGCRFYSYKLNRKIK